MTRSPDFSALRPPPRVGLDFGGVIVRSGTISHAGGTIFDDPAPLLSHARPGVLGAVRTIVERSGGNTWIVSKAREEMQPVIRRYLEGIEFFAETGLPVANLFFTLDRAEKRTVCLEHGITHFLDDRLSVLEILRGAVPHRFWFTDEASRAGAPAGVRAVVDWPEALSHLAPP